MFELSLVTEMAEQPQEEAEAGLECAVCLQTSIYPVQLPCSHVFCFLCVKGFSAQSKRCAMCRREIPEDFIQNPDLLPKVNLQAVTERAFEARTFPIFILFYNFVNHNITNPSKRAGVKIFLLSKLCFNSPFCTFQSIFSDF